MSIPLPIFGPTPAKVIPRANDETRLIDTFGRVHNNLRISVTDRCNLRCVYCMPEEVTFKEKSELLTFEEIVSFVKVAADLGINKIRLTGGEPLMRRGISDLAHMICQVPGIEDVGLTTNGLLLKKQARELYQAGLRRLNVSLDTLDEGNFFTLSRRHGLDQVLEGLAEAKSVGFSPIKVNAVTFKNFSEGEILPLAHYCKQNDFELRFIEYMPIGAEEWERGKVLLASEIQTILEREFGELIPATNNDPRNPAFDFLYPDGRLVGFIASISRPFCRSCNRLRLTAEGKLRNCLFSLEETDVRKWLRPQASPIELRQALLQTVWEKWEGHEINTARFHKPDRTMHAIGG